MEIKKLTTEQFNAVFKVFHFLIQAEYHCRRLLESYRDKEQHMSDLVLCRQDIEKAYDELTEVLSNRYKEIEDDEAEND